jgi:branched-chain amino acid transport system ATP-binding protein
MAMSALEIRNLRKAFGGLEVIANLNLAIPDGQRHAVIGPNGAGKTTLFNLITGWQPPTSGEILIHGIPVRQGRPDLVTRAGLSRSFQKNMLLESITVLENLRIACQAFHPSRHSLLRSPTKFVDVIRKARRAAEQMHLDTCLDRNVNELSYGQKRQLEVAVALCAEPKILLMDEPAAGTSPDERANLIKLINDLSPDLTIVLVEHDMDVVFAICDVITVLSYGKLLVTGRKDEIQSNQQVIEAYLGQHHA